MAKGLNFRNFEQPTFPLYMNDAEETLFTVTTPTVALVERIEANQEEIVATIKKGDQESIDEMWQLAADLISCNREHRPVTVEELKAADDERALASENGMKMAEKAHKRFHIHYCHAKFIL